MKKILSLILVCYMNNSYAVDVVQYMKNMFSQTAGYKVTSTEEDMDLTPYQKNECNRLNFWGEVIIKDKDKNKFDESNSLYFCNEMYNVRYDTKYKVPLWVAYSISYDNYIHNEWSIFKDLKYNEVKYNEKLPKTLQYDVKEYNNTNYVPHRLVPYIDSFYYSSSGTKKELIQTNQKRMDEDNYITNIIPVNKNLEKELIKFDGGFVKLINDRAQKFEMISGPLYLNGQNKLSKNGPYIPSHIFKIVSNATLRGSNVYIIPNKDCGVNCNFNNFIVPFSELEKLSNFTFFSGLAPIHAAKIKLDPKQLERK